MVNMGTHKIYSGIQGIRDNISGSLYGDCHELLALLYTFGEFLAKSLKITHLNLLLITEKASSPLLTIVSRTSFMILLHLSLNYSV